ncbi:hypothetical protein [Streptomyces sp. NPDC012616]|uniref:hypothetical protein n=1 Tax=Streptomyces sp. NPDC012616 TaxID=3364840 RepID=UPI0036E12A4B
MTTPPAGHDTDPTGAEGTEAQTEPEHDNGVRIEYRARVPRHMMGAALAEAFAHISRETQQQGPPPAD